MERIGPAVFETWSKNRVFGLGLGNFLAFVSSVKMFMMSEKDQFFFQFNASELMTKFKSQLIRCGCILITILYLVLMMAFSISLFFEDYTIRRMKSCYKSKNITSKDCQSAIQAFGNIIIGAPNFLIPVYISAYTYLIGREFAVLHRNMEDSSKLSGRSDNDIECFRLRYNDICCKVDVFAENHGILLMFSLATLTIGLVTCGYNFFAPLIIPAKYLWPTTVLVSSTMFIVFLGPVILLNEAKKPLELLSVVDMKKANERTMIQTQMFIESVCNFNGISVAGFMNMDKPGALVIIGVVVTYVLVVVQYQAA